jgi:hypothetical protein
MTSIETRINTFIKDNLLDQDTYKESICDLVNGCLSDLFNHLYSVPLTNKKDQKKEKAPKEDKIEDPSTVQSRDELRSCTIQILNEFCKNKDLKIGGNKTEVVERVWRFLQGESKDEDRSSKSKPKKEKSVTEKHVCSGKNAKGESCNSAGTELCGEIYLCWRHAKAVASSSDEETKEPKKEKESKKEKEPEKPVKMTKSKRMEKIMKKFEKQSDELVTDEE